MTSNADDGVELMKIISHGKKYIFRGLIALIPLALTILIVRFLYLTIDQQVMRLVEKELGFSIPGLGILIVLGVLYLVGLITSNVVGNQLLNSVEMITARIPIVRAIYQIGKQISSTFTLPEKQVFKRTVLVEFLKPGVWTVGFVTGTVSDRQNGSEKLLKVYVPTPPNPTSGFIVFVKESQTRDPGWSMDESLRTILTCGIIGPEEIRQESNK